MSPSPGPLQTAERCWYISSQHSLPQAEHFLTFSTCLCRAGASVPLLNSWPFSWLAPTVPHPPYSGDTRGVCSTGVCAVLGCVAVLQVGSPKSGVKGEDQFLALLARLPLMRPRTQLALHTLLARVQFAVNHHPQVFLCTQKVLTLLERYSLDIMRAGWKKKSVNKLHWNSYTYNHTSYKISLGESWAITVLLTMDFIPRPHLVVIISKRSDRRHYCLYEICINRKKLVILTQKFLRFVLSIQRCSVTKSERCPFLMVLPLSNFIFYFPVLLLFS